MIFCFLFVFMHIICLSYCMRIFVFKFFLSLLLWLFLHGQFIFFMMFHFVVTTPTVSTYKFVLFPILMIRLFPWVINMIKYVFSGIDKIYVKWSIIWCSFYLPMFTGFKTSCTYWLSFLRTLQNWPIYIYTFRFVLLLGFCFISLNPIPSFILTYL